MRIQALEIDGWGRVGAPVSVTTITDNLDGTIEINVELSTNYVGARFEFTDTLGAYYAGGYTLLSSGAGVSTLIGATHGNVSASGYVFLADPYRLANGVPDFVSGSQAALQWFTVLAVLGEQTGSTLPTLGGVAESESVQVVIAADTSDDQPAAFRECLRSEPKLYTDAAGVGVKVTAAVSGSALSLTLNVQPATTGTRVVWLDGEALLVTLAASTTATVVKRGILGTMRRSHPVGSLLLDGLPSPLGARARVVSYASDAEGPADVVDALYGVVDACDPVGATDGLRLQVSTDFVTLYSAAAWGGATASAEWLGAGTEYGTTAGIEVKQIDPFQRWAWFVVQGAAYRRFNDETDPHVDYGIDPVTGFARIGYVLEWRYNFANPVVVDEPADPVQSMLIRGFEQRDRFVVSADGIDWEPLMSADISPAHVFEDEGEIFPDPATGVDVASTGATRCNPVRALLQILLSTGVGYNQTATLTDVYGDLDTLPADIGLAVPVDRLDADTFILARTLPNIGNLYITAEDAGDIAEWLDDKLLRPFALALVTTRTGLIQLIDLSQLTDAGAFDLVEATCAEPGQTADIAVSSTSGRLISGLNFEYLTAKLPMWRDRITRASQYTSKTTIIVNGLADERGALRVFARFTGAAETLKPGWTISQDSGGTAPALFASQGAALVSIWRTPRLEITVPCLAEYCDDLQLGQIRSVTGVPWIGAEGERDTAATYYVLVTGLKANILADTVDMTLVSLGVATPVGAKWGPSGAVASAASSTEFTLEPTTFGGGSNPPFATDAAAFRAGDKLALYSINLIAASDNSPKIVSITGNVIVIEAAFSLGGVPVTDPTGFGIVLAKKSAQVAESRTDRGWLDYDETAPYTVWT